MEVIQARRILRKDQTKAVRVCTVGNAEDMGDTWAWPFESSRVRE